MVEAEEVEEGGVPVVDVDGLVHGLVAELVFEHLIGRITSGQGSEQGRNEDTGTRDDRLPVADRRIDRDSFRHTGRKRLRGFGQSSGHRARNMVPLDRAAPLGLGLSWASKPRPLAWADIELARWAERQLTILM